MPLTAAHGLLATATAKSSNTKIGDAAATYAAQQSCPTSCGFYNGGGCYAENGQIYASVTKGLNEAAQVVRATSRDVALAEAAAIDELRVVAGRPMRLHTVGDCATDEAAQIVSAAAVRYMQRGGGQVWTYTHAWRVVARESWGLVSVLASCETPLEFALARARGYAPSIVVDEFVDRKRYTLSEASANRRPQPEETHLADKSPGVPPKRQDGASLSVLPCPAQTTHRVTCSSCRLCMDDQALLERGYAIAFAVHGTALSIKKALLTLADPSDEKRKLTSRDHALWLLSQLSRWPTARELVDTAGISDASARQMLAKLQAEADDLDAVFAELTA